jgi:hypothetical protein
MNWRLSFAGDGGREVIRLGRCIYDHEDLAHPKRNDEVDEPYETGQGRLWRSRHFLCVQIITNNKTNDLWITGQAGWAHNDEEWWHFTDAAGRSVAAPAHGRHGIL